MRENLEIITQRISEGCERAGRPVDEVRLMAVSKRQPVERLAEAAELGLRLFGENRVQETAEKRHLFPADAEVHLIGHLQRNKARDAAQLYHAVQSLDSERIVVELEKRLAVADRTIPVLIEVNTSGEESKQGVESWDELRRLADVVNTAAHMTLQGLMTIGPISSHEGTLRSAFATLRSWRDRLQAETGMVLPELSMGMSNDLEFAVLEGSTMVRVGTALFGERVS